MYFYMYVNFIYTYTCSMRPFDVTHVKTYTSVVYLEVTRQLRVGCMWSAMHTIVLEYGLYH